MRVSPTPDWAASAASDPRVTTWIAAYYLWYDANYNTEVASRMVDRLKAIDDLTKLLVALTASGSLVAGWNLWSQAGFDAGWAALAGTGAVLSIIHGSLGIPARLKDWLEMKRDFLALRATLDGFRSRMQNHADFDVVVAPRVLQRKRLSSGDH